MAIQVNYGNKGLSNAVAELKGLMLAKPQPFLSEKPAETGVKERLSIERSITGLVEEIKGLRAAVKGQRNDQSYRKRSAQPQVCFIITIEGVYLSGLLRGGKF